MEHPHPNKRHVMTTYRTYLLGVKRKIGTARGLYFYRQLVDTYLTAKRSVTKEALCHGLRMAS